MALLRASRDLKEKGIESKVLCLKKSAPLKPEFDRSLIEVIFLGDFLSSPGRLIEIRNWHADVLMAWMPHAHIASVFLKNLVGAKKLVWNVRQSLNRFEAIAPMTRTLIHFGAKLSSLTDAIIYNSARGQEDHRKLGYHSDKDIFIPNGFEIPKELMPSERREKQIKLGLDPELPVVLFVGRNHPDKGVQYFLDAATVFLHEQKAQFLIAGAGFEGYEEKFPKQIRFMGTLSQNQLADLYGAADIFTSSSISEGFSNALGEAMANGCYPVATDVGDSKTIIHDVGRVIPSGSAEAIVEAWRDFLSLPAVQRLKLNQRAQDRAKNEYSLQKTINQYDNFINDLC